MPGLEPLRAPADPAPDPTRFLPAGLVRWREVGQGDHAVVDRPGTQLTATLGPCVAICLHAPTRRAGGMNHIFRCVETGPLGGAAVVAEVEVLVNALMRLGLRRSDLIAQVAGGARTLGRGRDLGGDIARVCLDYLRAESVVVSAADIGGTRPRRVVFDPVSGVVTTTFPGTPLPVRAAMPDRDGTDRVELFCDPPPADTAPVIAPDGRWAHGPSAATKGDQAPGCPAPEHSERSQRAKSVIAGVSGRSVGQVRK